MNLLRLLLRIVYPPLFTMYPTAWINTFNFFFFFTISLALRMLRKNNAVGVFFCVAGRWQGGPSGLQAKEQEKSAHPVRNHPQAAEAMTTRTPIRWRSHVRQALLGGVLRGAAAGWQTQYTIYMVDIDAYDSSHDLSAFWPKHRDTSVVLRSIILVRVWIFFFFNLEIDPLDFEYEYHGFYEVLAVVLRLLVCVGYFWSRPCRLDCWYWCTDLSLFSFFPPVMRWYRASPSQNPFCLFLGGEKAVNPKTAFGVLFLFSPYSYA